MHVDQGPFAQSDSYGEAKTWTDAVRALSTEICTPGDVDAKAADRAIWESILGFKQWEDGADAWAPPEAHDAAVQHLHDRAVSLAPCTGGLALLAS